jgi:hypothetical protein
MKLKIRKKLKQMGTALLVSLVLCSILAISITGYLSVAEHQNYMSVRSQSWNMAISVVEAGLEEGIEHLYVNIANCGADGWSSDGMWYTRTNQLYPGAAYVVAACITNPSQPVVTCRAIIDTPTLFGANRFSSPFMFAAGGVNVTNPTSLSRAVQIHCVRGSLFTKAMVARQGIDMNGQNVMTDSFDSSNWYKSLYGAYDPSVAGNNGDVACNANITGEVNIGQANIYGHVQTGPNGTATWGTGGGIGSLQWQTANGGGGLEPNTDPGGPWYTHDANFTFPLPGLPYSSASLVPDQNQTVTNVTYNITSNNIVNSSTYPNPVPWSGVTTNYSNTNTVSSYPGPLPGLTTNLQLRATNNGCANIPTAGTYVGSLTPILQHQSDKNPDACSINKVPSGNGGKYNYDEIVGYSFYTVKDYSYPTVLKYNYAQYATNAVTTVNHYDYVFKTAGQYYLPNETFAGKNVLISADVSLVLPSGLSLSGGDSITIASGLGGTGGGKLTLYVGGSSVSISGNGVANQNDQRQRSRQSERTGRGHDHVLRGHRQNHQLQR